MAIESKLKPIRTYNLLTPIERAPMTMELFTKEMLENEEDEAQILKQLEEDES